MSFEAKKSFENKVKMKLREFLPVETFDKTMAAISETLFMFDMEQKTFDHSASDDLLTMYIDTLAVEGRSPKTIERYRYVISRMLADVAVPTNEITVYHLRNYLAKQKETVNNSTLEGTRQVFSAYFNWLKREGAINVNPVLNLSPIKTRKKVREAFSDVDIEKLKLCCHTLRDKAIICFLYATGCRISEMTQLNIDDVDIDNLECKVLGKGNKERTVFLDPVCGMTLREYLNSRTDHEEALFVETKQPHNRLEPGGVRTMLNKLEELSGVEHVHPHKFRRTRATNLIKHGMPIQEVASILGHEKLDTTMKYVVMDKQDIKNAYKKYA